MKLLYSFIPWAIAIFSVNAMASCEPVQFGYLDQHRPPYWLGRGSVVPDPPGASVELLKMFAASAGCPAMFKRLPVLRIKPALVSGDIDIAPMDENGVHTAGIVFPRDKNERLDSKRSVPQVLVTFVRAADHIPRSADPMNLFKGRLVGITLGSAYAARLEQAGIKVDSGAIDLARNFDKLMLRRVDGFAITLVSVDDLDAYVSQHYGRQVVRLSKPIYSDRIWLAANQRYYNLHRPEVEAMWTWLGTKGNKEFEVLLEKYSRIP
ncbi:hypothetical protein H3H36_22570 [Duganella sp. FT3S]|uniref:Transporter substrate-binding domain-containing protein n=1 Tax=Rugamonas fusca TaxID=2758568 RepID=A0A7W2ELL9_9BURK|nr:hypothetical protein [Rugamonas fusca]MBA5608138.1 hypothetical protein [Rugamonas fusca]